jgi:VIT1/CCC1 family predicted Fe2+/Mn2+ transporter
MTLQPCNGPILTSLRVGSIRVVIVAGLAELFAGAISMGLGAWLAAETERKHYLVEEARERREVRDMPEAEEEEIFEIFDEYHVSRDAVRPVVDALRANEDMWVKVSLSFPFAMPKCCTYDETSL